MIQTIAWVIFLYIFIIYCLYQEYLKEKPKTTDNKCTVMCDKEDNYFITSTLTFDTPCEDLDHALHQQDLVEDFIAGRTLMNISFTYKT